MTTKKPALVKTESAIDAQRALFRKYGQERWNIIKLILDVAEHTTIDNSLEDTIVYLCHEVVKKDKPFQVAQERLYKLTPCTCDNDD